MENTQQKTKYIAIDPEDLVTIDNLKAFFNKKSRARTVSSLLVHFQNNSPLWNDFKAWEQRQPTMITTEHEDDEDDEEAI